MGISSAAKPRSQVQQENISLVRNALENGDFWKLPQGQQKVLEIRGYLKKSGPLTPLRELTQQTGLRITFQALSYRERRALARLKRGNVSGSRMTPEERKFIENNSDLSVTNIALELKHTRNTIRRWREELGVSAKGSGSGMTLREKQAILSNPSLPATELARKLGRNEDTIRAWRRNLKIPRKVGRPKKTISPELPK